MPDISVIIPLFNKEAYIERAIRSILFQTHPAYEIIVVDDGSTDNGPAIVEAMDDHRIQLLRQENAGVSSARNHGISQAKGDAVAFLDADDEWHPDFLEVIGRLLEIFPDAGLYATAYEVVTPRGVNRRINIEPLPGYPWDGYIPSYFKIAAFGDPPLCASSICIPRNTFDEVGLFQQGKRMGEDIDLWGRIAMCRQIAYSPKACAIYHHDPQNRACREDIFTMADEHPFIERGLSALAAGNVDSQIANDLKAYLDRLLLENARLHVISGNYKRARQMSRSFNTDCFFFRKLLWSSRLNRFTHYLWKLSRTVRNNASI